MVFYTEEHNREVFLLSLSLLSSSRMSDVVFALQTLYRLDPTFRSNEFMR